MPRNPKMSSFAADEDGRSLNELSAQEQQQPLIRYDTKKESNVAQNFPANAADLLDESLDSC